jgi:flagellar protein FlaG
MVQKVGSAGPTADSVIQYSQGSDNSVQNREEANESRNFSMNQKPVRIKSSAERRSDTPVRAANENNIQRAAAKNRQAAQLANSISLDENEAARKSAKAMELSQEAIRITVEDVNKRLVPTGSSVQFKYHEQTGRYSFKILDNDGRIVKEVPPEKSLDMVAKMFELVGIIVDERR